MKSYDRGHIDLREPSDCEQLRPGLLAWLVWVRAWLQLYFGAGEVEPEQVGLPLWVGPSISARGLLLTTCSWYSLEAAVPALHMSRLRRYSNRYQRRLARHTLPSFRRPSLYRHLIPKGLTPSQFTHRYYQLTGMGVVYRFGLPYWNALRRLRKRVKAIAHLCWQSPISRIGLGLCQVHPP